MLRKQKNKNKKGNVFSSYSKKVIFLTTVLRTNTQREKV